MATPLPVDRSTDVDEVWAWLEPRFREHGRQLYLFALGLLGNREDAEDATQIVLLNAYRALERGERPTWPRAWLFAIALNVCRRLRREASARRVLSARTRELLSLQRASDSPTGAEISHAVASLPPAQREIFLLRELRGLSYVELSEKLGLSLAAAESLLARARRRLREQLAASDENAVLRSPRRRPLMGIPGAGAVLRLARAPATFKLVAFAGTAVIAPALTVGLHAAVERSRPPALQAATPTGIQHVQRTLTHSTGRGSLSPAPMARTTRSRSPGAVPVGVRSPHPASADAATVSTATTAAASPEPKAVEVVNQHSSPAGDASSSGATARPPAKPSDPTRLLPVTGATGPDAVDDVLATTEGAVDDLVAAVPVPAVPVPADAAPAVPSDAIPDPPPVVQEAQDAASSGDAASAVPDVLRPAR
jgi:RNA polymerase sigma-70 factor (ECF subfamily)